MAGDIGRVPSDRIVEQLQALYAGAQRELVAQIKAAVISGNLRTARQRRLQLAAAIQTLERLGVEADPLARGAVLQASLDGAGHAAQGIRKIGVDMTPVGERTFAAVNAEAVATMQDSLVASLQGARATVGRQVNDVYASETRRQVVRSLIGAEGSPQSAKARLARQLSQQGQTGFVDRAGRRWSLDRYAQMATRTVTREAVVQGSMARMAAHGVSLARVSIHAGSCEICRPYEGRLVDLGGDTRDYQGEPVMDSSVLPPFHPNCRHTLQPFAARIEEIRQQLASAGAS